MGRDYDRLVAQETLIFEATEAVCEAMEPDQQDDSGKVTRKELAQRLGCTKSHVTQLLSGERNLTLRSLADMAGALDRKVTLTLEPIPAQPATRRTEEPMAQETNERKRFGITAHLGGPWKWAVWDNDTRSKVAFHVEREDAQRSAEQLNENGYRDA